MSQEAPPHELEVEAAGLIRAALTGDAFAIDRIVTRAHKGDLDWRSFATEVTYTAACLLIVASGSRAQATTWWIRGLTAGCGSGWRLRRHTADDRPRGGVTARSPRRRGPRPSWRRVPRAELRRPG